MGVPSFLLLLLSVAFNCIHTFPVLRSVLPDRSIFNARHASKHRKNTCVQLGKAWWDDELPNILGINPIEAAVLFGALYYIYGPQVLYDYAKEAGKVVSTYAPVIRDVSMNLYYEFKDYFEEDKERDEMRKAGFDIDDIPRRTSTVVQRVQSAYQSITEAQSAESASSLQGSQLSGAEEATPPLKVPPRRELGSRPSKRKVYGANNIEVQRKMLGGVEQQAESIDAVLLESIESVKDTFTALKLRASDNFPYDSNRQRPSLYPFPDDTAAGDSVLAGTTPVFPATAPLVPNKFYQQLTGEWNQRILDAFPGSGITPLGAGGYAVLDTVNTQLQEPMVALTDALNHQPRQNIPSEVSSDNCIDVQFTSSVSTDSARKSPQELLREIDADYAKLRQKLVSVIENSS